jgi:uncharacterized membrane protein YbhN (UPF0104 family)
MMLLALIALIYVVSALPVGQLSEIQFRTLFLWTIPVVVLMHSTYLYLSAEVWRRLVFAVTGVSSKISDAYLQMASVAAGKYVPGKIWGIVARTGQLQRIGVSAKMSVVSSVIEQLAVFVGGSVVAVGAALLAFPQYAFGIAVAGAALLLGLIVLPRFTPRIIAFVERRRGGSDIATPAIEGVSRYWLKYCSAHVLLWLISGTTLCVIYFSLFGGEFNAQGIAALILANTIGFIVGFLAVFAPGGLGVREATMVAVLTPFFPIREALIAAIVLRALWVFFDGINCGIMIIAELRHAANNTE